MRESGLLRADDLTVIFATGSGLMHVDLVDRPVTPIDPNAADLPRRNHRRIGRPADPQLNRVDAATLTPADLELEVVSDWVESAAGNGFRTGGRSRM